MSSSEEEQPRRLSMQQRMHQLADERVLRFAVQDQAREEGWQRMDLNDAALRMSFEPPPRDEATVAAVLDVPRQATRARLFLLLFTNDIVESMLEQAQEMCSNVRTLCVWLDALHFAS